MKIICEVKCEDVVAFNIQHLKKISGVKKVYLRNRNRISSLYGLIALGWLIYEPACWPFAWVLMFLAILWFFFYPKIWELRVAKKVRKVFKEKQSIVNELEFSDDGIWAKNATKKGQIPWAAVKRIISGDRYIFLYLTEDDAIIIPRDGLEDFLSWEQLSDSIKAWAEKNIISIG